MDYFLLFIAAIIALFTFLKAGQDSSTTAPNLSFRDYSILESEPEEKVGTSVDELWG